MGSNIHGALGSNPTLNYSFAPTLVEGLGEVSKIECGPFHMCAISEGFLYSWGKGIDGQLGHGNTKNMSKPTKVEALGEGVESVSCGTNHTLTMLKKDVIFAELRVKMFAMLLEMAFMGSSVQVKVETVIYLQK